jgi:hypothetical protein
MRTNGSVYVAIVFAALVGYFTYQWWFNPVRAVKRRLGEVAAALSFPAEETDIGRVTRLAELRRYLADDIHVRGGATRNAVPHASVQRGRSEKAAGVSDHRGARRARR